MMSAKALCGLPENACDCHSLSPAACRWMTEVYEPAWLRFCEEVKAGRAKIEDFKPPRRTK
jgi:hypothetical protein